MEIVLGWMLIGAVVGALIANAKGGSSGGHAVLGAFLGPIGWLITAFSAGPSSRCPYCRSGVAPDATACPHCGRALEPRPHLRPTSADWASPREGLYPNQGVSLVEQQLLSEPRPDAKPMARSVRAGQTFFVVMAGDQPHESQGFIRVDPSPFDFRGSGWLPREQVRLWIDSSPPTASAPKVAAGAHATSQVEFDDLERLAALHERGVLTDEEFAAKKKQILGL